MRHRALDYERDTPVSKLGLAALDELLDRGDLDDWAPLAREIRGDPWGHVAGRVERLLRHRRDDGTRALWQELIDDARRSRQPQPIGPALRGLRERVGITQSELARRLGATQPEVSKLEHRSDVRLSTARAYVAACGGELRLRAHVGKTVHRLD
jgi:DNA-binding XRE family transcriptional regulator